MAHRFYCPNLVSSGSVTLEETEAHHLLHVMRHQLGDVVELFDGRGMSASCCIEQIGKRDVRLVVGESRQEAPCETQLILASAVPKGDRFDWLVEKCTELGVHELIPITTRQSIVDPRSSKLDKLRQTVITACKQSGRNLLMKIHEVMSWTAVIRDFSSRSELIVAHPQGDSLNSWLSSVDKSRRPIVVAIGPEGGFTDDEVESALKSGAKAIQLGSKLLRIETAAIAVAAKILI